MNIKSRLKKAVAGVSAMFVFTSMLIVPTASAQTYQDVPSSRWSYQYVEDLVEAGVLTPTTFFRPADALNRAELLKMVLIASGIGVDQDQPDVATFADVSKSAWFFPYVETAVKVPIGENAAGDLVYLVEGYRDASGNPTGLFGPSDAVNRAAATKILSGAFAFPEVVASSATVASADLIAVGACDENPFTDVRKSDWFYKYFVNAYWANVMDGYKDARGNYTGKGGPGDLVTREQAAKLVANGMAFAEGELEPRECDEEEEENEEENEEEEEEEEEDPDVVLGEGELEVVIDEALAGNDQDVPFNVSRLRVLPVLVTAGKASVTLSSIKIGNFGLGDEDDIDDAWIENEDGEQLSNESSFTNDEDSANLKFLGRGLTIPAGETVLLNVVVSLDAADAVGNTHFFSIVSADSIKSNAATVVGDFALNGPTFRIANYEVAEIEFERQGADRTVEVGDTEVELGRFEINNKGGTSDDDVLIKSITLEQDGTLDSFNLGNVALYFGSRRVSDVILQGDDTDFFTFTFKGDGLALSPNGAVALVDSAETYQLLDGDSRVLTIKGDILAADGGGDNVQFNLDEGDRDIVAYEKGTGYGCRVVEAGGEDEARNVDLRLITVDAGDFNLARAVKSPPSENVAPGTDDFIILVARITAATGIRVKELTPTLEIQLGEDLLADFDEVALSDLVDDLRIIQVGPSNVAVASASNFVALTAQDVEGGSVVSEENLSDDNLNTFCNAQGECEIEVELDDDFEVESSFPQVDLSAAAGNIFGSELQAATLKSSPTFWYVSLDFEDEQAISFEDTTVRVEFAAGDVEDAEYLNGGDDLEEDSVKGNAEGNVFTITNAALECTRTDGIADDEAIVAGNNNVLFGEFACDNNDSGRVTISDVSFDFGEGANDVLKEDLTNMQLFVEDTLLASNGELIAAFVEVGSVEEPEAGDQMVIDQIDVDVESSGQIKFQLRGEVTTAAADELGNNRTNIQVELEDITAFDQEGDELEGDAIKGDGVLLEPVLRFDDVNDNDIQDPGEATLAAPLEGPEYNLVASGLLTQNISGDTPNTAIYVANFKDVEFARFKMSAVDDHILLDTLTFVNADANDVIVNNAVVNGRVGSFKLYGPTEGLTASTLLANEELIDTAFNNNGTISFDLPNNKRVFVEDETNSTIRITGNINSISNEQESGQLIRLNLVSLEAISQSSGENVTDFETVDDLDPATDEVCIDFNGDGDTVDAGEFDIAVAVDGARVSILEAGNQVVPAAGQIIREDNGGANNNGACDAGADTTVIGDGFAEEFIIRNTKPVITYESLGTSTLTTAAGLATIRFKVTADKNDDVHLSRFTIDYSLEGVAITGGFEVFDVDDPDDALALAIDPPLVDGDNNVNTAIDTLAASRNADILANGDNLGTTGNFKVQFDFAVDEEITRGTSKTYEVRADVANIFESQADGDNLSARLSAEEKGIVGNCDADDQANDERVDCVNNLTTTDHATAVDADNANIFVWSDESAPNHSRATADYANGFQLKFPTTFVSLSR